VCSHVVVCTGVERGINRVPLLLFVIPPRAERLDEPTSEVQAPAVVALAVPARLKPEKLAVAVTGAVEVGATAICLHLCRHDAGGGSPAGTNEAAEIVARVWRAAVAATQQCGARCPPLLAVHPPQRTAVPHGDSFALPSPVELSRCAPPGGRLLWGDVPHIDMEPHAAAATLSRVAREANTSRLGHTTGVLWMVGPEGGWSDDERAELRAAGGGDRAMPVQLGGRVLRVETAAVVGVAALMGW